MRLYLFGRMLLVALAWGVAGHAAQTEYVFLVTGDGIRHQELFTGADLLLLKPENKKYSGIEDLGRIERSYGGTDARIRREKLFPFFWKHLAREGVVLGNRSLGSEVTTANPHRFSYPGYAEILNGQYVPEVTSNDAVFSPRETVLEYVGRELKRAPEEVAVFGSWKIFNWITMRKEGAILCNAGYESMAGEHLNDRSRFFNRLQFDMRTPWDTVRHDVPTLELALEYIQNRDVKFTYLALGETDDWAHDRRYDRVLDSAKYFDDALEKLWTTIQNHPRYSGKSTLIITTDHGRGRTLEDWTSHGTDIKGGEEVWIAVVGPDTPDRGELSNTPPYMLSNIAATILRFYGLEAVRFNPKAGKAIAEAFAE